MLTMTFREKVAALSAQWIGKYMVPCVLDVPTVSFTFDDFPYSALDVGGRILESEGISGTFYTALGLANSVTPVGRVGSLRDLASCADRGHEIGCHTYDHVDCMRAPAREVDEDILRNQAVARDLGLPRFRHFAYPFGHFSIAGKRTVMRHYKSARTTMWGVNRSNIDLSLLRSVPIYSDSEMPALEHYFDALDTRGGWLIFYTHDVSGRPSPSGCTPEKLMFAIRRCREIGAAILPVGAVVEKLSASRASDNQGYVMPLIV